MSTTTWEQSVEKARLASLKSFEGRLEVAKASFEQIPANGKGVPREQTLAKFAAEAGLEYDALGVYRQVARWWGDFDPQVGISWTFAREAMRTKKWKTGKALVTFTLRENPPEPFLTWTLDALRVHLGKEPTNTGKVALKAMAGESVSEDEHHAAAAKDAAEESAKQIRQVKSRKAHDEAYLDASATLRKEFVLDGPTVSIDPEALRLRELPGRITDAKLELIQLLEEVPAFIRAFGKQQVSEHDDYGTAAELVVGTVHEVKGEVDFACDSITGELDAGLSRILSSG